MTYDFTGLAICAKDNICKKAAGLFAEELLLRTGFLLFG